MEIKIYSQDGTLKLTASPGSGGQCVKQLQGDSELSLSFDYFSYVALDVNDYVDFCGDRYWLLEQYRPKEVSTIQWRYDVKLYGIESLIKRYLVIEHTDGDANPVFTLTAPASQHMLMIVECLNNATGTTDWHVGTVLATGNITIDYTGKYCDEGLRELAEAANTEYWFSGDNGKTLNLSRCERGETIELEYGAGLISLERDVADNAKFYTRLYPVGSSRNINPETYGHTRLQLPNNQKYVDLDIARYGVIDHYEQEAFAGIYPRYTGTVSTVRVEDRTDEDGTEFKVYFIKDASLPFNPNNFLLPNEKIRISFQTGDLQGLGETDDHYFEADYNSTTGEFEIINIWTDGEQLPRPGLEPEAGNSYIPWNISMPQTYITRAEQELAAAVNSYNQAHFVDNSVYRGTTNHVWIEADQSRNIYIGRLVKLVSSQYFPGTGYRNSRIVKITRRLDLPSQMELEISDAVSTGTLTKINDDIRGVWDFVKGLETDDNGKWLSKRHNDTAQGLIRFIRGLQVGERFVTGLLGEGGIFRKEADGTTYIEADKLYIRMKAYFDSVEIRDYKHSAGNRIQSPAGAKCCRVEWIDASGNSLRQTDENFSNTVLFRCYFRGSDGEDEVRNNFVIGDQAYCHVTTVETEDDSPQAKGLNMKHYWRLVVGRNANGTLTDDGEHWIDLSNKVSETLVIGGTSYTRSGYQSGSDVPEATDDITQLGNINDTDRQGAIIEFVTGADAPSYQIFQGINSFNLNGKNYIGLGYSTQTGRAYLNVYGDTFIGVMPDEYGNSPTYLKYNAGTRSLEIKAKIDAQSTIDGETLAEFIAQNTWTEEQIDALITAGTEPLEDAIEEIQRQVDGSIATWFYDGVPTLNNQPASGWTTAELKNEHLGDLYYDNLTGYAYRFKYDDANRQWSWGRITDVDVTKALADAAKAQDTADHKRRIFVVQPTPPYDQGDLWVNATYPSGNTETNAAQNKYYNDVLRCNTTKASGTSFAIADWGLASKYTDDQALLDFKANNYVKLLTNGTLSQDIGKAQNAASQAASDASAAQAAADNAQTDADAANDRLDGWADDGVISPTEKTSLKVDWEDMKKEYAQICNDANKYNVSKTEFASAYTSANAAFQKYTASTPENITIGSDYANIAAYYAARQTIMDAISVAAKKVATDAQAKADSAYTIAGNAKDAAQAAEAHAATLDYVKTALKQDTIIDGGLVISTLLALRDGNNKIWSGINGAYNSADTGTGYKGHGIAAWYGGAMVDKEVTTTATDYAKSLFRFDGSGYVAGGNLSWDKSGNVTIQGYSISVGDSAVATQDSLANYLPLSAGSGNKLTGTLYAQNVISKTTGTYNLGTTSFYWKYLFVNRIYLADDVYLEYDSANTAVKLNGSFYATGGVSALGAGSGGSSGGIDMNVVWNALANSGSEQINSSHLTNALGSYAERSWVLEQIPSVIDSYTKDESDSRYYAIYGGTNLAPSETNPVNIDTLIEHGNYYCSNSSNTQYVSTLPDGFGNRAFRLHVGSFWTGTRYIYQRIQGFSRTKVYERYSSASTTSWSDWYLVQDDLANYVTASSLATTLSGYVQSSELNGYLPLTGGTMTGNAVFKSTSSAKVCAAFNYGSAEGGKIYSVGSGKVNIDGGTYVYLGIGDSSDTTNGKAVMLAATYFKPLNANTGVFDLGTSSARWNGIYGTTLNVTGDSTVQTLTLSSTSGVPHLIFSRGNYNYITAPASGSIAFVTGGKTVGSANTDLRIADGAVTVNGTLSVSGNTTVGGTLGVTGATTLSSTLSVTGASTITGLLTANGGITIPNGKTLKIGDAELSWDSTNQGIKVTKGLYSQTFVSALGVGSSGSSPVDMATVWSALANNGSQQINVSHLTTALSSYATAVKVGDTTYSPSGGVVSLPSYFPLTAGSANTITGYIYWKRSNFDYRLYGYNPDDATRFILRVEYEKNADTGVITSDMTLNHAAHITQTDQVAGTNGYQRLLLGNSTGAASANSKFGYIRLYGKSAADATTAYYCQFVPDIMTGNRTYTLPNKSGTLALVSELGDYLPTTGGTMTGGITMGISTSTVFNDKGILFGESGTYGRLSSRTNGNVALYAGDGGAVYIVPNSSSAADNTGRLIVGASTFTYGGNKIWHAGNVGPDSGLDADLLDGLHASDMCRKFSKTVSTGAGVKITFTDECSAIIFGRSTSAIAGRIVIIGNAYNTYSQWICLDRGSGVTWCKVADSRDIELMNTTSGSLYISVLMGRGTVTFTDITGLSGTAITNAMAMTEGNVASATKLQEKHKIWGQDFDGTADITGDAEFGGDLNIDGGWICNKDSSGNYTANIRVNPSNNSVSFAYGFRTMASGTYIYGGTSGIQFRTNGTTARMIVDSSGNVGIGTTSPTEKLEVSGKVKATKFIGALEGNADTATKLQTARKIWGQSFNGTAAISGDMTGVGNMTFTNNARIHQPDESSTALYIGNESNKGWVKLADMCSQSGEAKWNILADNGYANFVRVGIGLGSTAPSYTLHVSGNIYATGAVTCLSDIREKSILGQTEITVEQIAAMRSIVYKWNDNVGDNEEHVGSIAQDWQKALPQVVLVANDEKKTLSLQYGVAALVSAITVARKVVDHEHRIKELEDENKRLKEQFKIA